jgi:hypothetical protein
VKVRKTDYGKPPAAGAVWIPGENQQNVPVEADKEKDVEINLETVVDLVFVHTPDDNTHPERIYKVNNGDTSVDHSISVVVTLPKKPASGPGTQFVARVDWSVEADAGNCPKANKGKDNTDVHFIADGSTTAGSMKMDCNTQSDDSGQSKIKLSASAVSGDKFRVTAKILKDPGNPAAGAVKTVQSPWFEVWKKLNYNGLYRMKTGGNIGVDVDSLCVEGNIQPAYTPAFTEYHKGAVHDIAYKEFVSDLLAPTAAQLPNNGKVQVQSDGADTRVVTVNGITVAADGKATVGSENVTLNGTTGVSTTANFQKVTTVTVAGAAAGRTITISAAGNPIGTIVAPAASASPNFLFDTAAAVQVKAQAWTDANETKWGNDLTAADNALGAAGYHLVGFAYLHPKHSGNHAGVTSFYTAYPGISIAIRGSNFHPDVRWNNFDGMNIGQMSSLFLNVLEGGALGSAYTKGVARHEIGHASDHISFGPGDHCPQAANVCLMNANSTAGDFCTAAGDHSQHKARGWS